MTFHYKQSSVYNSVAILGAGGHTKQIIDIFDKNGIRVFGIFDDYKEKGSVYYKNYIIKDTITSFLQTIKTHINRDMNTERDTNDVNDVSDLSDVSDVGFICGIGDNEVRRMIVSTFMNNGLKNRFVNCISQYAHISESVKMGVGNYIGDFTIILSDTTMGDFNIINTNSNVAHDIKIGNFNHIAPSSVIGGTVSIGDMNLIGTNATINLKINIGNGNTIGCGCVVIRNITNNCTAVGNPAKIINLCITNTLK